MINAEFLASCSDEQVEKGVAWCQVAFSVDKAMASENVELYRYGMNYDMSVPRHYCSNPNDIMPIAISNDIEFVRRKGIGDRREFIASKNLINSVDKNPYRAICEVYILMSANK